MGNWQGVRIDFEHVQAADHDRLTEAMKLWGAGEVTWDGDSVSVYQGNDWIYDKEGVISVYRNEAPKWPNPFRTRLDKDEYDTFHFDLKKASEADPHVRIVVTVEYDFYGDSERLTIEGGKIVKREKLDWIEDVPSS